MIVTYPWPVASANVELTGPQSPDAAATCQQATSRPGTRHLDEMVRWSGRERLRLGWYRFRLAVRDSRRASRRAR